MDTEHSLFSTSLLHLVQLHDQLNHILRRDQHKFIFITIDKQVAEAILLHKIRERVRFKVALYPAENNTTEIITVSPYKPRSTNMITNYGHIIKLHTLKNNNYEFSSENMLPNLFLDFTWNFYGYPMIMSVFKTIIPTLEVTPASSYLEPVFAKRGFLANLTQAVHDKLNISCGLRLCRGGGKFPDGTLSGVQISNGTWLGCMGDIISGRVDISIAAPVLSRFPFVDFLPKHKYDFIKFLSRQPRPVLSWKAIYKAFRPLVWSMVGASTAAVGVVIWIGGKIGENENREQRGICSIFFDQVKVLLSQSVSYPETKVGVATSVLILLWLLVSLIYGTAYNSKLTSLMAIPEMERDFPRNFFGLITSPNFKVGANKAFLMSIGGVIFKHSTSPVMKKIYAEMEQDESIEKCMRRALISDYACVEWDFQHRFETGIVFADNRGVSPFFESQDMFNFIPLTQIVRKREVFRESYGYFLENAHETGLNEKWADLDMRKVRLDKVKTGNGHKNVHIFNDSSVKALTLSNFLGSFIILGVGLSVGAVGFLVEIFWKVLCFTGCAHKKISKILF